MLIFGNRHYYIVRDNCSKRHNKTKIDKMRDNVNIDTLIMQYNLIITKKHHNKKINELIIMLHNQMLFIAHF